MHTEYSLSTCEIPATQKLDLSKIYWQKLLRSLLGQPEVWSAEREELNQLYTNPHFKSKNNLFSKSLKEKAVWFAQVTYLHFLQKYRKILLSIYFPKYVQVKKGIKVSQTG